jgi:general secretion pathway protein D
MKWFSLFILMGLATAGAEEGPDLNRVQQQELVRRQEQVIRAQQALQDAAQLEAHSDWRGASNQYRIALDALGNSPATAVPYQQAMKGLIRSNFALYARAKETGDRAEAKRLLEEILKYDPKNSQAASELARITEAEKDPTSTAFLPNPAKSRAFQKDLETVQDLFVEAEQLERTGQYDLSEMRLKKILSIDPYNSAAQKKLEHLAKIKIDYARHASDSTRQERLSDIEGAWTRRYPRDAFADTTATALVPMTRSTQFVLAQKLKNIILPEFRIDNGTIDDAVSLFVDRSKALDPDKQGVNIIVKPEASTKSKQFTLTLKNVPLGEALRYATQLAGLKYKVEEYAIYIVPLEESTDVLLRREFTVSPAFFNTDSTAGGGGAAPAVVGRRPAAAPGGGATDSSGRADVKESLTASGVDFSTPGATAVYLANQGKLQVINTQAQLDLIEELTRAGTDQTLIVEIQTKLVEINQNDLNDLTMNYALNPFNTPLAPGVPFLGMAQGPSFNTSLRGVNGINAQSLDQLVFGAGIPSPNILKLAGSLDNRQLTAALTALAQKKSTDLLSAPTIRVKNGDEAKIDISRTFFYPTAFDKPESVQVQQGVSVVTVRYPAVIPAFPNTFEKRPIGVVLTVRPQVGADKRTISLPLVPSITDFEGFINYGDPIRVGFSFGGAGGSILLNANVINQPVFNTRKIKTDVFVRDGFTVVLGGLLREDIQTINDKIPLLGDLPLIGRAFQSKATQSIKKNLLIFVTGKIFTPDGEPFNRPDQLAELNH